MDNKVVRRRKRRNSKLESIPTSSVVRFKSEQNELLKIQEVLDKRLTEEEKELLEKEKVDRYRFKYKPEYCNLVRELMRVGKTKIEVARDLDIGYSTFLKWEKEEIEFRMAVIDGHFLCMAWWLKMARQNLKSRTGERFNTSLYMFMMKNLFKFVDEQQKVVNDLMEITEDGEKEERTGAERQLGNSSDGKGGDTARKRQEDAEVLDILRAVGAKSTANTPTGTEDK